jgi:hypothetical protein
VPPNRISVGPSRRNDAAGVSAVGTSEAPFAQVRAEQSPRAPLRAATGFRTYCSAGAKSGRAVPDLPSGDPRRLLRVGTSSYLMAPGPPAFTEIARFPAPPRASGAGVLQCDLLAVLETKDGPQRDGDAFRPVGLPGDSEELRLWLDPFQGGLPANPSSLTIASRFRSSAESSARPFSACGSITDLDPPPFASSRLLLGLAVEHRLRGHDVDDRRRGGCVDG